MLEQLKTLLAKYFPPYDVNWQRLDTCIRQKNLKPFYIDTSAWPPADREEFGVLLKSLHQQFHTERHQKQNGHVTWTYKESDWTFGYRPTFTEGMVFVLVEATMARTVTKPEIMAAIADHIRGNQTVKKKKLKMEVSVHVARSTAVPYLITKTTDKKQSLWRVIPS